MLPIVPNPAVRLRAASRRTPLLIVLVVVLVAPVACFQLWNVAGRIATVEPGRLYRAAELAPDTLVAVCRRYGITTVVDLRTDTRLVAVEAAALAGAGIAHVAIPSNQVPDEAAIRRFLELMDRKRTEAVLVHCTHGSGRTGVFTAIYRMEYDAWSARRALLEEIVVFGALSFLPGTDKGRFLLGYRPREPGRR